MTAPLDDFKELRDDYEKLRHHLRIAQAIRKRMAVDYDLDGDEMADELRLMIWASVEEQRQLTQLLTQQVVADHREASQA